MERCNANSVCVHRVRKFSTGVVENGGAVTSIAFFDDRPVNVPCWVEKEGGDALIVACEAAIVADGGVIKAADVETEACDGATVDGDEYEEVIYSQCDV